MFDPARHQEQFTGIQNNVAITQANGHLTRAYEEENVRVEAFVPDKFSLDLDQNHIMTVEFGDRSWSSIVIELA